MSLEALGIDDVAFTACAGFLACSQYVEPQLEAGVGFPCDALFARKPCPRCDARKSRFHSSWLGLGPWCRSAVLPARGTSPFDAQREYAACHDGLSREAFEQADSGLRVNTLFIPHMAFWRAHSRFGSGKRIAHPSFAVCSRGLAHSRARGEGWVASCA